MAQYHFPNVWFADDKRNRSLTKMIVFKDRGSLDVKSDFLEFTGRKSNLLISHVKQISIAHQQMPWIGYLIMNVLLIIYLTFMSKVLPSYLLVGLLLVGNAVGLIVGYSTKWIRVEYADDNNRTCIAFLADDSSSGWGGIFGGTEKMYPSLRLSIEGEKSVVP